MEDSKKKEMAEKKREALKAKKNANSITKEKKSKAQKPNSAKKAPVASGNIKSIFASMSKPKDPSLAEIREEGPKEEQGPPINSSPVKEEYIIQPFENKVPQPEKPEDKSVEVQQITESPASV